ncbi:MAG: hypothetical protein RIG63_29770 [Coleofasciculus chthonoplastes F3-SA18-01]|uniref:hypothetical protein n=1 Tax=Coleofasciculus chthonoplastes TaxID=64178 RepID=UPI0032F12D7B
MINVEQFIHSQGSLSPRNLAQQKVMYLYAIGLGFCLNLLCLPASWSHAIAKILQHFPVPDATDSTCATSNSLATGAHIFPR